MQPYRYPHFQKTKFEALVKEMLMTGTIQPSTNPYSSSVFLVKKYDGMRRMCIDYKALNKIILKDV